MMHTLPGFFPVSSTGCKQWPHCKRKSLFPLHPHPPTHAHTHTQPHRTTFHDLSVISRSWGCQKGKTVDYFSRSSYSVKFKVCVIAKMHKQSHQGCKWTSLFFFYWIFLQLLTLLTTKFSSLAELCFWHSVYCIPMVSVISLRQISIHFSQ